MTLRRLQRLLRWVIVLEKVGRKVEGCCDPFRGRELGPQPTQCRLVWGLPPYQLISWSMQPFGHNRHWPKSGGAVPFPWGSWVSI